MTNVVAQFPNFRSRALTRHAPLQIAALLTLLAPLFVWAETGGVLTAQAPISLFLHGEVVGSAVLQPGTPVLILRTENGRTEVRAASGSTWVNASDVKATGVIPAFVEAQAQRERMVTLQRPSCGSRSSRTPVQHVAFRAPPVPDLPTGREDIRAACVHREKRVLTLTNAERAARGLPPLKWDEDLARAARFHAAHMANFRYFDHRTLGKTGTLDPQTRMRRFSLKARGENIAQSGANPEEVVAMWMRSPGHRQNILRREAKTLGVGNCGPYWVQNFGVN